MNSARMVLKPIFFFFVMTHSEYSFVCLVAQLCLTLCDLMDCSPPVSSVHGILQVGILEWVAIPLSRDLPDPGIEPGSLVLQAGCLLSEPPLYMAHTEYLYPKSFVQ